MVVAALALMLGGQSSLTAKQIYQQSRRSVVRIESTSIEDGKSVSSSGSGFFFWDNGLVATAYHVIKGATSIKVFDFAGDEYGLQQIALNPPGDVALLRLSRYSGQKILRAKRFGFVSIGDTVFTIGNSLGLLNESLSQGIVSGKRRVEGYPIVQMTVAISPGNSGDPVIDDEGKVVGIVRFTLTHGQSLNLAVAIDEAIRTLGTDENGAKDHFWTESQNWMFWNRMHP